MHPRRHWAALAAVGATLAAVAGTVPAAGGAAARTMTSAASAVSAAPVSVTLITGDTVTVTEHGTSVQRAPGRSGVRFVRATTDGHQYVIPSDALPLLREKQIDQRLFDITLLQNFGYTGTQDPPLLVQYAENGRSKARTALTGEARIERELPRVGMMAIRQKSTVQDGVWNALTSGATGRRALRSGIRRVFLDGRMQVADDASSTQIGAQQAWDRGLDGTGVTVAVLDSGIDATHPDLAGRITESANFTDTTDTDDDSGHGTHVASIIAGSGVRSSGKYQGVAPGAKLAIGKVCDGWCPESAVLAGMEWAAPLASVINMSLNGYATAEPDPISLAIPELSQEYGTLFVIAASNTGAQGAGTVQFPGDSPDAVTVGAVDGNDQVAAFSGRGPTGPDELIKPDITAPGVGIVAARAVHGTLGTPVDDGYVAMDGTSMATPHVAAAAAILAQEHPDWTPQHLKTALMGSAHPTPDTSVFTQGAGRLDLGRAVTQEVSADEGSLSFGRQEWPHTDDEPITRALTYRNSGKEPVTLKLSMQGDTGTFSAGDTELTVPAGATASTTVVADTKTGTDGLKSGYVVATGADGVSVVTPVGIDRGAETHDVSISHLGRDGQAATNYYTSLIGLDGTGTYQFYDGVETETHNVPRGTYGLVSTIFGDDGTTSMVVDPSVTVDDTRTITVDARTAQPVSITPPRTDARQAAAAVGAFWAISGGGTAGWWADSLTPGDLYTAQMGSGAGKDGFVSEITSTFAQWKNDEEGFADSPWTYDTAYVGEGTFPTGFVKKIEQSELMTVEQTFAREADGATGVAFNLPVVQGNQGNAPALTFSLPFRRTAYLGGTAGTVTWQNLFRQNGEDGPLTMTTKPELPIQARKSLQQSWNAAVFAPSATDGTSGASRDGDRITAAVPMFTDGTGASVEVLADTTSRSALYADGVLIKELDTDHPSFPVPTAATAYRLEMSTTRTAPFRLSTTVGAVWTFTSQHGDTELPLSTVRFSPALDSRNAAPAGRFSIPVTVVHASGTPANQTLTAQFSTDDGTTWKNTTVSGSGDRSTLQVTNPASGFVSLRAVATDASGDTVTQTVLRAYSVR
ncbi:S8 family serine peptidase [Kineosporia sp. J2-2]|uniref:S8 family serine peptidase n=1 Tax=Kineosporia corallincola TaxID=2835133 RepID=A0ABS5TFL8_9ACTN|nr:S8 family serine peptidase [Kineosporia corallincola]MBT0769872.1 S8 family serine peptidase [Kineosporia corallincola]